MTGVSWSPLVRTDITPIVLIGVAYGLVIDVLSVAFRYFIATERVWSEVAPYATLSGVTFHMIMGILYVLTFALMQTLSGNVRDALREPGGDMVALGTLIVLSIFSVPGYTNIWGSVAKAAMFVAIYPLIKCDAKRLSREWTIVRRPIRVVNAVASDGRCQYKYSGNTSIHLAPL